MQISEKIKYCFSGYGQYILFNTIKQAKSYLKKNSTIYRIKDLLTITPTLREKISNTSVNDIFECIDDVAVPMDDTRSDDEIRDQLWNDDDSTEQQEDHAQWYRERAQDFEFHPFTLMCDMCLKSDAFYIGVTSRGTPFGFCKICRDELQALKIERTQKPIAEPADWCDGCDGGCWMCGEC